jgi:hypothetical protein
MSTDFVLGNEKWPRKATRKETHRSFRKAQANVVRDYTHTQQAFNLLIPLFRSCLLPQPGPLTIDWTGESHERFVHHAGVFSELTPLHPSFTHCR